MTVSSTIERLAAFATLLDPGRLGPRVAESAGLSLIDTVGVMIAGAKDPLARTAATHALATRGSGPCRIVGSEAGGGPLAAALANGVAAHVLDFDDSLYEGMTHPSAAILPALLAAADVAGARGIDILAGLVVGIEIQAALGRGFSNALYDRGIWTTGFLGAVASAAGAARVMRLDKTVTARAIALAACQAAGSRAVLGSDAKPYLCGRAAEAGLDAVLAAMTGLSAPTRIIEGPAGLAQLMNDGRFDIAGLDGLGAALERPILGYKRFPVCSSAQAPIEATQDIMCTHDVKAADVARVDCVVTPFLAACLPHERPGTPSEARFSLAFAVACTLANGTVAPAHLSTKEIARPKLHALMARVATTIATTLVPAEEASVYPEAVHIAITTRGGERFERMMRAASCLPPHRAHFDVIVEKFRANTQPELGERSEALLDRLARITNLGPGENLLS